MGSGAPRGPGTACGMCYHPYLGSFPSWPTLTLFQVSVTAREDVPAFGPPLPSPPVFQKVRNSPSAPLISKTPTPHT